MASMVRPPLAIALAVASAVLIIIGRVNAHLWWGIGSLALSFALLIVAGAVVVRANPETHLIRT